MVQSTRRPFFTRAFTGALRERVRELETERQGVEEHLRDPAAPWTFPKSGAVRRWGLAAHQSEGWRGMPWLLRLEDYAPNEHDKFVSACEDRIARYGRMSEHDPVESRSGTSNGVYFLRDATGKILDRYVIEDGKRQRLDPDDSTST